MMKSIYRLRLLILISVLLASQRVLAQPGITSEQKKAYAKQFQAAPPPGGGASLRELRTLLDAQEMRMSAPADVQKFRTFLRSSPSFKAMSSNQTPELGYLLSWNEVALQATALDHYTLSPDNPPPTYG
jgi:hypothetical protein